MRDAFETLAAHDPAAVDYRHPDPARLAARIAATGVHRPTLPVRFRLAVAAAATVSGVATIALVAAITAAPTLPILAFATTSTPASAPTFAAAKSAQGATAVQSPTARPVAGSFGPQEPLGTAYQLMVPASSLTATMDLGAALRVVGTIGGYNGTVFTETSATGARVTYETTTGIARWSFAVGTEPGPTPARFAAAIASQHWGYNVTVGTRTESSPVVVDGSTTTLRVRVTIRDGRVIAADGPAFIVSALSNYRLRSPTDALRTLSSARPTTATSVELSWSLYTLADHTVWLLPTFVYRGHSGVRAWAGQSLAVLSAPLTATAG